MCYASYKAPWFLKNGVAMTLYTTFWGRRNWESTIKHPEPPYQQKIFIGAQGVPIFGLVAIPENARGTVVGTYGITGELANQWYLSLFGRKAYAQGYAVVLFDWRGHGKTAELSPTLTSDGLYEGEDFVRIAAAAKAMGCPGKFWFTGYSLGGQLALWSIKAAVELTRGDDNLGLKDNDIGGTAVICPSLDSKRSLAYLVKQPVGKYIEKAIAIALKKLAWRIHDAHPRSIDPEKIQRIHSIWSFDHELVIDRLGFNSVEEYYEASSALHLLPTLEKPTLIIYAENDPLFDPAILPDLQAACANSSTIDLLLTRHGGHIGYLSSTLGQQLTKDPDPWWAWNRILQWIEGLDHRSFN
ncbi:alpha/beta fold hydrolase [Aetokthonos hydrillicola Thurmond2011]|jgi:hypothetical protein|uniref:Alpha/beta fold hydrolase n=1 Tax=Aetokthonos hydrillicola Thurmond2011 TaxID=2712845 RepID=A0AAP5I9M1_9CYAN|nr:alpha/beta fold hydrolase [Aetokthonos hydrillicola]MBO3461049.1 alpha/beta fold hydrolase [Aetokthonos hydrillicola CCALA 1050]MBW4586302.1 alpha/beta fold hydrolase [Aetokthonos hydrillicola CCALA 1050]MDR9897430.1 alpha/beta fold hydrolase [Aetokthonos hydrillicola Thurmond2011]